MKRSFNAIMEDLRILIWNTEDPTIKSMIEQFGYTTEKIEKGKSLFAEVESLAKTQQKEYSEQYNLTTQLIEKREEAEKKLNDLRKFSKFAFRKNKEAYNTLKLGTALPTTVADWHQAAKYFYEQLQEKTELITALAPFSITVENITENLAVLSEIKELQELRQRETGDAQRATQMRNTKFEELKEWCAELRQLAKILFEDENAQYLEKLGIIARS